MASDSLLDSKGLYLTNSLDVLPQILHFALTAMFGGKNRGWISYLILSILLVFLWQCRTEPKWLVLIFFPMPQGLWPVPWPRIEPMPLAVKMWSPNLRTTKGIPSGVKFRSLPWVFRSENVIKSRINSRSLFVYQYLYQYSIVTVVSWCIIKQKKRTIIIKGMLGFPGSSVMRNLHANARDTGSIPDSGRSHTPQDS